MEEGIDLLKVSSDHSISIETFRQTIPASHQQKQAGHDAINRK
jgi:hypothetical protein